MLKSLQRPTFGKCYPGMYAEPSSKGRRCDFYLQHLFVFVGLALPAAKT
jgi:hypothetical protein